MTTSKRLYFDNLKYEIGDLFNEKVEFINIQNRQFRIEIEINS